MNDSRFKWLVTAASVVVIAVAALVILPEKCSTGKSTQEKSSHEKVRLEDVESVYVCTSTGAKVFHAYDDCFGLSNCSRDVIEIDIDEAMAYRKPCRKCFRLTKNA